ncbi:MAG: ROK family transcriptional regulator [Chloroflexi bacterium]|nr:MAG: ROK family transcriptional regulator [Chloroflexota bacterium]
MKKATQRHTKQHNSRLILKTIYTAGGISRADIARNTGLTRTTVSTIVSDLMQDGLVGELGIGPSAGGKPPIVLGLLENARQFICLDLSKDPLQGALVNLRGQIVKRIEMPLNGRLGNTALNLVTKFVNQLRECSTATILGIGIGSPGLVDTQNGIIKEAVNLSWHNVPLKSVIEAEQDLPVYVANDSHLAALAEYSFGGSHIRNLVLIKTGLGIGSGIVINGQLYHGAGGNAGEIGHVTVGQHGAQCSCGNIGCLEAIASMQAIMAQAQAIPVDQWQAAKPTTWDEFCIAVHQGDATAQKLASAAGDYIGMAAANLVGILNIREIVIAGAMVSLGDALITAVCHRMHQNVIPGVAEQTTVKFTNLGADLVLQGASALILTHQLGVI